MSERYGGAPNAVDTVELARRVRLHALRMNNLGGTSHIGSVFSMADLLAVLYGRILRVDPERPGWSERDRFVLSKGHAGAGVYAVLAERGFFDIAVLDSHGKDGSILSGHVSHKDVPGVELSTGSLGHGLSVATGMALAGAARQRRIASSVLLSDGECDEGSNWEAIMFAAHHRLANLVASSTTTRFRVWPRWLRPSGLEPFARQVAGLRLGGARDRRTRPRRDPGHFRRLPFEAGRPSCVIAHTIKGKGVSFMENSVLWHYRTARGRGIRGRAR